MSDTSNILKLLISLYKFSEYIKEILNLLKNKENIIEYKEVILLSKNKLDNINIYFRL